MSVIFQDLNFKLACLDLLLDQGFFSEEFEYALSINPNISEYQINKARLDYFNNLPVTQHQLDQIISFSPDGGDNIYFHVMPAWSGEESALYITNFNDLKYLRYLQYLSVHAVAHKKSLDLSLLTELKHLKKVETTRFFVVPETMNESIKILQNNHVEIELIL